MKTALLHRHGMAGKIESAEEFRLGAIGETCSMPGGSSDTTQSILIEYKKDEESVSESERMSSCRDGALAANMENNHVTRRAMIRVVRLVKYTRNSLVSFVS